MAPVRCKTFRRSSFVSRVFDAGRRISETITFFALTLKFHFIVAGAVRLNVVGVESSALHTVPSYLVSSLLPYQIRTPRMES